MQFAEEDILTRLQQLAKAPRTYQVTVTEERNASTLFKSK
jgi:hypothetical protein